MLTGKSFEATVMLISLLVSCASYLLIVWKDRSWINWATPAFFFNLGGRYVFQFASLALGGSNGSHYAYAFCYTTYALSFLVGAVVYVFVRPLKIKPSRAAQEMGLLPWVLLLFSVLLYLPILIEFRAYLAQPRRIYELTRTGYGIWTFGSSTFSNLAFITYLFEKRKTTYETIAFCSILVPLTYWHGSKGLLLSGFIMWILYRVYVERKSIRAFAAAALLGTAMTVVLGSFALFANSADLAELFESVTSFADYVRNAMQVIDDDQGRRYYGRLTIESALYPLVPRALMPDKPKDFGPFALAKIYSPANYRNDEGDSAFDIGYDYADFGPFSIIYICLTAAFMSWMTSSMVLHLRRAPTPGAFIVFLYFAGFNIIPITAPFFLPEMMLVGGAISLGLRFRAIRGSAGLLSPVLIRPAISAARSID